MPIRPSAVRPSYAQGFADSAATSAYPESWKGLEAARVYTLGPTGGTSFDISGKDRSGTISNGSWAVTQYGYGISLSGTSSNVTGGKFTHSMEDFTWLVRWRWDSALGGTDVYLFDHEGGQRMALYQRSTTSRVVMYHGGETEFSTPFARTSGVTSSLAIVNRANVAKVYVDGQTSDSGTTMTNLSGDVFSTDFITGARFNNVQNSTATMFVECMYSRPLTDDELRLHHFDPYHFVRRRRRTVGYVAAAPSGFQPAWAANSNVIMQ